MVAFKVGTFVRRKRPFAPVRSVEHEVGQVLGPHKDGPDFIYVDWGDKVKWATLTHSLEYAPYNEVALWLLAK